MSAAPPAGSAAISKPVLAALIHDTAGALLAPLGSGAADLTELFGGIALSITEATHPEVVAFLQNACGAHIRRHRVGEDIIGRARRSAVELALEIGAPRVFHSDFDSVLRWSQTDKAELGAVLARPDPFLIVGRNPDAFAGLPQRLQQTEHLINHVYALMTGQHADLLAAVRSMSRPAAQAIVDHAKEEGIGNDVEWPLLALRLGFAVTHVEVAGISYRTIEEYGAAADSLDAEPLQWIRRIEFAAEQARVLRKFP